MLVCMGEAVSYSGNILINKPFQHVQLALRCQSKVGCLHTIHQAQLRLLTWVKLRTNATKVAET